MRRAVNADADGSFVNCFPRLNLVDRSHLVYPARLKNLLPSGENVVQRLLEMRRRFGELASHLLDVLLIALFDLFTEELLERAIANALVSTLREVDDQIGDERAT